MKQVRSLITVYLLSVLSLSAFADDASIPKIDVKGINPGSLTQEKPIEFYGKNVDTFFKMLPGVISVDSNFDKMNTEVNRQLTIQSKSYDLTFVCSKGSVETTDNGTYVTKLDPNGTKCIISVTKNPEREGDGYDFKPIDPVPHQKLD